ncbi:unnamed protein product [Acanthoscelides obtectus]|uniref:Uncharacterized protein n=1 Tax=Acanthoscelides obtectus TaxID=200917 RepID=A0A9P0KUN2_ACAOB|nr:unnamed protein product [Acanthoscelides obtectus]CAK1650585.1 hypothetical protein AOBTE_LOCUS16820 [Acanthoscelides obtectus]
METDSGGESPPHTTAIDDNRNLTQAELENIIVFVEAMEGTGIQVGQRRYLQLAKDILLISIKFNQH